MNFFQVFLFLRWRDFQHELRRIESAGGPVAGPPPTNHPTTQPPKQAQLTLQVTGNR